MRKLLSLLHDIVGIGVADDLRSAMANGHRDFFAGPRAWRTWWSLGLYDIRMRYKRTLLGPLWIAIGTAATFTMMSMVFSAVLKTDVTSFLPYLSSGMIIWGLASAIVNEGPQIFVGAHHIIDSFRMPLTIHVLRCMSRNMLVFGHNFVAFLLVSTVVGATPNAALLLLLVTIPLLLAALYFAALILAVIGARYRDLTPIISMALQLLFFLTPIIWTPDNIPDGRKYWIAANPIYHLLEIVRAPMTGKVPPALSVAVAVGFTSVLGIISYLLFRMFRRRIPYWL